MSALTPFRPAGPTVVVAAAAAAPGAVQCVVLSDQQLNQNYVMTNSGANIAFIAMGPTKATAEANCGLPTSTQAFPVYPLLNGSQVTISGPANAWFTGITTVTSCTVYVTPGYGQ